MQLCWLFTDLFPKDIYTSEASESAEEILSHKVRIKSELSRLGKKRFIREKSLFEVFWLWSEKTGCFQAESKG